MKIPYIFAVSIGLLGCQPQQTDIFSEVRHPDGSVSTYINKSNGYGYNPNRTEHYSGQPVVVPNYGIYYNSSPFVYVPGCRYTPGSMPIPENIGIYNYNPTVYWNGCYYRAR